MVLKAKCFLERIVCFGTSLVILGYSVYRLFVSSRSSVNLDLLHLRNASLIQDLSLMQDAAEIQWTLLSIWMGFIPYLLIYSVLSSLIFTLVNKKIFRCSRIILSIWLISYLVGFKITIDILLNLLSFLCTSHLVSGNCFLIWAFGVLIFQVSEFFIDSTRTNESSLNLGSVSYDWYMILYAAHFNIILRSLSVALSFHKLSDNNKPSVKLTGKIGSIKSCNPIFSVETLLDALDYSLYPYPLLLGPLVLYSDWVNFWTNLNSLHSSHYHRSISLETLLSKLISLVFKAIRLLFWSSFWSLCLCLIYPNSFSYLIPYAKLNELTTENELGQYYIIIDRGTVGASIYLRCLHLYITYLQFYGWPYILSNLECLLIHLFHKLSVIARSHKNSTITTDQIRESCNDLNQLHVSFIPEPPACLLHFVLVSECWRSFDRGLYNFIKSYIVIPVMKFKLPSTCKHSVVLTLFPMMKNWLALTISYSFILLYHGIDKTNAIWLFTNLLLLFSERSVKWVYRHTNFGSEIRYQLSDEWIRRLSLLLCATSGIFSALGNMYFLLGSKAANQLSMWLIHDPTLRLTIFVYFYCQLNVVTDLRNIFPSLRPQPEKKFNDMQQEE
ncbi:hypothetical protein MN116_004027 [Schistosoma mekongi]|uniref:Uncharacterized protein n=1 Tax=Schistosoma mekongi TaxID=38744 RepID=A0AAE2D7C9_SCHME|nr:hypothetical protein MN116_004027 [Schistosoma mekongi]